MAAIRRDSGDGLQDVQRLRARVGVIDQTPVFYCKLKVTDYP
jgi:hypothetical protein